MIENDVDETCPNCGAEPIEPEGPDSPGTLIRSTSPRKTLTDWGIGEEWTETHRCHVCETVYSFQNGYP